MKRSYPLLIEQGDDGLFGFFPDLPGLTVAGTTREEVVALARESRWVHSPLLAARRAGARSDSGGQSRFLAPLGMTGCVVTPSGARGLVFARRTDQDPPATECPIAKYLAVSGGAVLSDIV
jgi:hypothetical protein